MSFLSFRRRHDAESVTLGDLVPLASDSDSSALQDSFNVLSAQLDEHKAELSLAQEALAKVTIERDSLKATVVKLRDELKTLRAAQTQKPKDEAQK